MANKKTTAITSDNNDTDSTTENLTTKAAPTFFEIFGKFNAATKEKQTVTHDVCYFPSDYSYLYELKPIAMQSGKLTTSHLGIICDDFVIPLEDCSASSSKNAVRIISYDRQFGIYLFTTYDEALAFFIKEHTSKVKQMQYDIQEATLQLERTVKQQG